MRESPAAAPVPHPPRECGGASHPVRGRKRAWAGIARSCCVVSTLGGRSTDGRWGGGRDLRILDITDDPRILTPNCNNRMLSCQRALGVESSRPGLPGSTPALRQRVVSSLSWAGAAASFALTYLSLAFSRSRSSQVLRPLLPWSSTCLWLASFSPRGSEGTWGPGLFVWIPVSPRSVSGCSALPR